MATPLTSQARSALAFRVRKQLMAQASAAVGVLLGAVQQRLLASMDETVPSRDKQTRRDAWMAFNKQKNRWQEAIAKDWQTALMAQPITRPQSLSLDGGFELVGTDAVENKIIASRLALGLMEVAANEVNDLRTRLKFINNGKDLHSQDLVHPESLFLPVVEQWTNCGMAREAWPVVNDTVEHTLFDRFKVSYAECNILLVEQGILPVIEFSNKSGQPSAAALAYPNGPPTGPGSMPSGPGPLGGQSPSFGFDRRQTMPPMSPMPGAYWQGTRAQVLVDQISRLLTGGAVGPAGFAPGAAMAGGAPYPGGGAAMGAGPQYVAGGAAGMAAGGMPGVMGNFVPGMAGGPVGFGGAVVRGPMGHSGSGGALHSGAGGAWVNDGQTPGGQVGGNLIFASVPLANALAQQPVLGDVYYYSQPGSGGPQVAAPMVVQRVVEQMRQQSSELKSKAETDTEKAIIELVALMFQAILEEDRIPTGIRVWFARLQMPVLRIALSDGEFFTNTAHPTRQLIDHMGSCVLGFDASGISTPAMETEVKRIVQVIEQYPETGVRVYQRVYEEFQAFLKKHLTSQPSTQKFVGIAEQVEQRETLTVQYTIELRNQIKDMPIHDEIREFLYKVWAEVLAVTAVRAGPQHEETLLLKKAAADLIWSASAKPNRVDRARVISNLPDLLQSLRTGMTLLNMPVDEKETCIKSLSAVLVDAFMSKTQPIAESQIKVLTQRLANLEDYVTDDGSAELPLDAQNIEDLLGIDASNLEVLSEGGGTADAAALDWARQLDIGAWFTLTFKAQRIQIQYVWRSPLGHLHLFGSGTARSYLIQSARLAAYIQARLLEPQEREPLTLRATRNAMSKLEAHPERLLA
jgi:hypothetical protein